MAGKRKRSWRRVVLWVVGVMVVLFAVMQAVPYGRSHTNPPIVNAFKWADPQAESIARASCYDCHSNETDWWWATNIAPFSWLTQADVDGGRRRLNFSDYRGEPSAAEIQDAIQRGMPPFQYTVVHPNATLSAAQKQTLVKAYSDSFAANGGILSDGSGGGSPPTVTTTGTDAVAVAIIDQACSSNCHSADAALGFHAASAAEAQALIDDMVRRGAKLTAEQKQVLIKYFTR